MEKRQSVQQIVLANWKSICHKMKLNLYLSPCTKLNSKWIKDLGIRPETLHQIKDKVGPNFHHVGLGSDFINKTPKAQEIKARINKLDELKIRFSSANTINNVKREPTEWEKVFSTHTSDRALISKIYKLTKTLHQKYK